MELDLGPEIAQFRAELRDWIAAAAPPELAGLFDWNMVMTAGGRRGGQLGKAMAHPAYQEWTARLREKRLICPQWPEELGGQGMDAVRVAVLNEEFHRAGVPRVSRGMGESLVEVQQDLNKEKFYKEFVDLLTRPTPQDHPALVKQAATKGN